MAFTDILIAVHGIGAQQRSATVRSVATRVAGSPAFAPGGFAPQPLGYFHSERRDAVKVAPLAAAVAPPLDGIGFAEVFWADLPQKIVDEGRTLEDIQAWGRTIVARARSSFVTARTQQPGLIGPDFGLASEVIEEIVETIRVLENLSWITDKAGVMKFDVKEMLDEYVGDVQIVTEFTYHRQDIIGCFHRDMEQIHKDHPHARLHIIAHSEGTVIAFLGLAHALSGQKLQRAADVPPASSLMSVTNPPAALPWVGAVHGFMTIGSPIDKHLLLWPELRKGFKLSLAAPLFRKHQIRWRNYYDKGDPVGFELESARRWLAEQKDVAFEFCGCPRCRHDLGFSRYPLPGKAHNDYWDDPEVFEHFICDVVLSTSSVRPGDRRGMAWISPALPFVLCALLLIVGTYFLYKHVTQFTHPELDPLQRYIAYMIGGKVDLSDASNGLVLLTNSLGLAALIAGVTVAVRLPRLAAGMRLRATACWLGGAALYCTIPDASREAIGFIFGKGHLATGVGRIFGTYWKTAVEDYGPTIGVLAAALLVTALGLTGTMKTPHGGLTGVAERRLRWLRKGARPLIVIGTVVIAIFVALQMRFYHPPEAVLSPAPATSAPLTPQQAQALVSVPPPVWPVLLAGVGFLYLWWLATLIFDLAFVWNRYVRGGVALQRLRAWESFGHPPPGGPAAGANPQHPPPPPPADLIPRTEICRLRTVQSD